MRKFWFGLFILVAPSAQAAQSQPLQSQAQWEAAVRNESSSPSYVLVTIVDENAHDQRTGCTQANFIKGALFRQQKLAAKPASFEKVRRQMIANRTHVFGFSSAVALSNVTFHYTPAELDQARQFVQMHRDQIASHRLSPDAFPKDLGSSDAFACALIEQGYQASANDQTGMIDWKL